jgi:hypothetical protein
MAMGKVDAESEKQEPLGNSNPLVSACTSLLALHWLTGGFAGIGLVRRPAVGISPSSRRVTHEGTDVLVLHSDGWRFSTVSRTSSSYTDDCPFDVSYCFL